MGASFHVAPIPGGGGGGGGGGGFSETGGMRFSKAMESDSDHVEDCGGGGGGGCRRDMNKKIKIRSSVIIC